MISEREFSHGFSAFWSVHASLMTPQYISRLNLNGVRMRKDKQLLPPIDTKGSSDNDVASEIAFGAIDRALEIGIRVADVFLDEASLSMVVTDALAKIELLRRDETNRPVAKKSTLGMAHELSSRVEHYLKSQFKDEMIKVAPFFRGCGLFDNCYGDILASTSLIEIKMVDRNLRSADIKQALLYCALNFASKQYEISHIVILNPLRGLVYELDIEDLADGISRRPSVELFHEMLQYSSERLYHA